jgi:hypothetical protein
MMARPLMMVLVLTAGATLASCGSNDEMPSQVAQQLQAQASEIRSAVEAGDAEAARTALHALERDVASLQADGTLEEERADSILAATRTVLLQLRLLPNTEPTVEPTTSPSPEPEESGEDHHDGGKEKGHDEDKPGKHKGHGD